MHLENDRIIIRTFEQPDAKDLFEMCSDYDTAYYAGWRPHKDIYISSNVVTNYIYGKETMAIVLKETNKVIGTISLYKEVFRKNTNCRELGFCLNKKYRQNHYMSDAVKMVLDYGFNKLKLDLIYACTLLDNLPSQKILENSNFLLEGIIRDYRVLFTKEVVSVKMYSLLKEEYWRNQKCAN